MFEIKDHRVLVNGNNSHTQDHIGYHNLSIAMYSALYYTLLTLPLCYGSSSVSSYLAKYGYLRKSSTGQSSSLQRLDTAIKKFQLFAGLPQTGEIDRETEETMRMRRCGVKDIDEDNLPQVPGRSRQKRYALQGSRWKTKTLTYKISKYPSIGFPSRREVDKTIKQALNIWAEATNLKFVKSSGSVHIDIRFERGNHGDEDNFDGRGGTLAHAFFPIYGGDVHFDADENWTVDSFHGTSLLMSASHELGHSLGLAHSNVRGSLMSPFYSGYKQDLSLHSDDMLAIQALYGGKGKTRTRNTLVTNRSVSKPKPPTNTVRSSSFICKGYLDTLVTTSKGVTYSFLGGKYWKLSDVSVEPGYPRLISEGWKGLPWNLDAAFTWTNGKTYFFKGSLYWRFTADGQMDDDYPKVISEGFENIPNKIDAAFVWPVNNKIYFFKGSRYWKYEPDKSPSVDADYPKPISNWDGIPDNLDSVMQYSNGKTYFFKNGKYYRFDDSALSVDTSADPPYPRDTGYWWFGCK